MVENQVPLNQTQFSFEEPIFENKAVYMDDKPPEDLDKEPKNKKKTFIIVGVVGFIIIILFLVIAQSMTKKNGILEEPEEDVAVVTKELGPLQKRIDDARELLDLADPTKQDLAFPPIDMKIRLDPKER